MVLYIFWSEPLSEFVIVTSISLPDVVPRIVIPEPSLKSNAFDWPKSVSLNGFDAEETLTPGTPIVASDKINEPSASHLSVAKLYTNEWEPVTLDAAFECVPTPLNCCVSIPNPPVVGSVLEVPVKINVSSTSNVAVFKVVWVPLTVKSPVIVTSFATVRLLPTVTLFGKPTVTVFEFSTTSISPDVPWIVSVSPKLTGVEFVPSVIVQLGFDNLLFGIEPANLEAAMLPANILFSTDPAAIVAVNVYVAVCKSESVTEPVKSPANWIVGSASKLISKFWFVASQLTATPVSVLFANKSWAL